ncbi:uncharacterized protein SPPG_02513 [Spizellomyces punctatus DAOM BR117]|uniref:Glutathione S-transferase n=1 Tax=Spizellomyces punctatus (strain DAOM BR117) TaxID=645134 RepID=A0A0L0HLL4_SPIPD|nr:uncharacterized protein SPPG_02513 [Spizellomyces punctatus DAOM BR117]KND02007.1 hypothetical protein SPPG_02513 [Spizellomyces punctatus DAOM BR117]|eukprot:XP_016610046.1 hypothetical protein SPPG_02513 [Spizellomyces punctatus DAOM BR117]
MYLAGFTFDFRQEFPAPSCTDLYLKTGTISSALHLPHKLPHISPQNNMTVNDALGGTPVLTYFPYKHLGLGEVFRLFFADAGIPYEEAPATKDVWPGLKKQLMESGANPIGSVPIVKIGDKVYHQTMPTVKYFSKKIQKYLPSSIEDEYFLDQMQDIISDWRSYVRAIFGQDEAAKQKYHAETLPKFVNAFETFLGRHPDGPYLLGKEIMHTDFPLYQAFADNGIRTGGNLAGTLEEHPRVKAFIEAFENRPPIKAHLADRQ